MTAESSPAPVKSAHSLLVLPVVLLSALVIALGISGTAIALPAIAHDLGADAVGLQWVVNGFNLTFAAFTLVWGVLSDRIGYRLSFVLGLVLLILGSVASAIAGNILVLDGARLVAGIGAASLIPSASAILSNSYEGPARARAFAFFGTTIGVGLSFGPTLSGLVITGLGWRAIFVGFAALAVLSLLGSGRLPHVRVERVPGQKSVDFSVLRNRGFLALTLVPTAGAIGFVTILSYLPTALSAVHGTSAGQAGVFELPLTLPVLVGPILAAQLIRRIARVTAMTIVYLSLGCLIVGDVGLLLLAPGIPAGWLVPPMILLGFGFGLVIGLVDGEALSRVPVANTGTAAGVLDFVRQASEAVAVAAYAAVLGVGIAIALPDPKIAAATFAGTPGHGTDYSTTVHFIAIGMAVLVAALTIAIVRLSHSSSAKPAVSPASQPVTPA